jgi:DNA-binding response OmpR family regulator
MTDRYRVLHVDDDPEFLQLTRSEFADDETFEFVTATGVDEGFETLRRDAVDCLVSDSIRTAEGEPFVAAARRRADEVPIVLFTGHELTTLADETLEADPSGYVRKGTAGAFDELRDRLTELAVEHPIESRAFTRGGSRAHAGAGADAEGETVSSDGDDADDDGEWRVVAHHDWRTDDEFAVTVVRAARHLLDTTPDERLYDVIDPESLERLLARSGSGTRVRFEYGGHEFKATADGTIAVRTA